MRRLHLVAWSMLLTLSCGQRTALEGKSCPCATGYLCCEEVCVPDGTCEVVPGGVGDSGASDSGTEAQGGMPAGYSGGGPSNGAGGAGGQSSAAPAPCIWWKTRDDVERRFIVPTCANLPIPVGEKDPPSCHNGFFKPTLDRPEVVAMNLLVEEGMRMSCKTDPLINKDDWTKSYVLVKTDPALDGMDIKAAARCPSGTGNGKARMPYLMPALTAEQYACLRWYVYQLATQ